LDIVCFVLDFEKLFFVFWRKFVLIKFVLYFNRKINFKGLYALIQKEVILIGLVRFKLNVNDRSFGACTL